MLNCLFRCFLGDFVSKGQCLKRLVRTLELCRLSVCRHKNSFVCCVALCTLNVINDIEREIEMPFCVACEIVYESWRVLLVVVT